MPNFRKMQEKYAALTSAQRKALDKKRAAFIKKVEAEEKRELLDATYKPRIRKARKSSARKKSAKRKRVKKTVRKTNPAPLLFIITAKGTGKKMHYDGAKFSERSRVVTFATPDAAKKKALELLAKYPVLRKYRVAVEHNQHLPPKH